MDQREIFKNRQPVVLTIKFDFREAVPVDVLTAVLNLVEAAAYDIETQRWKEVKYVLKHENTDFKTQQIMAIVDHKREQYKGKTVQINNVTSGSIIADLGQVAITYWLLESTLGETFKEAWKSTSLHEQIKNILLTDPKVYAQEILERLERKLAQANITTSLIGALQDVELEYVWPPNGPTIIVSPRPLRPLPPQFTHR